MNKERHWRQAIQFNILLVVFLMLSDFMFRRLEAPWPYLGSATLFMILLLAFAAMKIEWRILQSVEFAAVFMMILAALVSLGTFLMQGKPGLFYARYYPKLVSRLIMFLRLDNLYYSRWFLALLVLFATSLVVVSLRYKKLRFWLIHLGIILIFIGAVVGDLFGWKGYMPLRRNQPSAMVQLEKKSAPNTDTLRLPFQVTLKRFDILYYPEKYRLVIYRKTGSDFNLYTAVDPAKKKPVNFGDHFLKVKEFALLRPPLPGHPAVGKVRFLLTSLGGIRDLELSEVSQPVLTADGRFVISLQKFRNPMRYRSELKFRAHDREATAMVEVNHPVSFNGIVFYQSDYDPDDQGFSGITVKKDPGYPLILLGMLLVLAGMILYFYRRKNG